MTRKTLIRVIVIVVILLLVFAASRLPPANHTNSVTQIPSIIHEATSSSAAKNLTAETVTVLRVIDGDTIELTDGRRVRYIGMDTPEIVDPNRPVECFGKEAREENKRLVTGSTVRLEKDVSETDKYGRLLRYVYTDDILVNNYLVQQGFARADAFPPDVKFATEFVSAENEARQNKRGLWSSCP